MFKKYFPETLIVPSMGNNDGKYHYQGIDLEDKQDFFSAFFEHWFLDHPHNSQLANIEEIRKTFMFGGYYRVDVDVGLSVLALNTLYLNKKNNATHQSTEAADQLTWLESQLSSASPASRKFIITNHIYPGAKYDSKSKDLLTPEFNTRYFDILSKYSDKIIIEGVAHDHYSDLRYHSSVGTSSNSKSFYHSMLVSPGVTPIDGQNPGVAVFDINDGVASNLVLHFVELERTYGWNSIPEDISVIPFRSVPISS